MKHKSRLEGFSRNAFLPISNIKHSVCFFLFSGLQYSTHRLL
jgi:hypothetical protein